MTEPRYRLSVWRWISTVEGQRLTETSYPVQPQTFERLADLTREWIRRMDRDPGIHCVTRHENGQETTWTREERINRRRLHSMYEVPLDWPRPDGWRPDMSPRELLPEEQA